MLIINHLVDTVTSHNKYFLYQRIMMMLPLDPRVFHSFFFFLFFFPSSVRTPLTVSLQMQTDVSHLMTQRPIPHT